jgi:hypothetical protein
MESVSGDFELLEVCNSRVRIAKFKPLHSCRAVLRFNGVFGEEGRDVFARFVYRLRFGGTRRPALMQHRVKGDARPRPLEAIELEVDSIVMLLLVKIREYSSVKANAVGLVVKFTICGFERAVQRRCPPSGTPPRMID